MADEDAKSRRSLRAVVPLGRHGWALGAPPLGGGTPPAWASEANPRPATAQGTHTAPATSTAARAAQGNVPQETP